MMSKKRIIGMITIAALMAGLVAMPVMAASKKKIKSVNVKVTASITPETRIGSEDVQHAGHGSINVWWSGSYTCS